MNRFYKITLSALLMQISGIALANSQSIQKLDPIIVTATREEKSRNDIAQSISVNDSAEIEFIAPSHPAEILNRNAGVYINNLGGEGHMSAIRQPIATGGVYLFLEDGIPTRPTGLFNHNGLYEINLPQSDRIEIIKGPGSALYGSDSIGGIINSSTKTSASEFELKLNPEIGSYGWKRLLSTISSPINDDHGFRIDLNITDNEGWRDESQYSRYATTSRIDSIIGDYTLVKSILSYNRVDQSGISSITADDYRNNPKNNLYHNDIARRQVDAFRLSTEISYEPNDNDLYTFTPFFRHNQMKLMPSWMLNYDPNDRNYQFQSYGLMSKYRYKTANSKIEFIIGNDIDYSPSNYREIRLSTTQNGDIFTDINPTDRVNYDFDANQLSISPYLHGELQILKNLRITTGLRYDYFTVDYNDNLDSSIAQSAGFTTHLRPESQKISYDHFSPKFGTILAISKELNIYANYRHSFRVPAIGQLFRAGSSRNSSNIKPVNTDSFEIGTHGQIFSWLNYDLTLYHMIIKDDIVSYIDNIDNDRKITNAGQTKHEGIEIGLNSKLNEELGFKTAWSFNNQKYDNYTAIYGYPATEINYAGNNIGKAPASLGNLAIQYQPNYLRNANFEFEWEHLGIYYTDETNSQKYSGHNLFNFRANYDLNKKFQIYGKIMNITNKLYSTYSSNQVGDDDIQYRPGLPRSFFMGVKLQFN
jgi:outer membrane receptor protein involved in Fe transport